MCLQTLTCLSLLMMVAGSAVADSTNPPATLQFRKTKLGKVLATRDQMTLYVFADDQPGRTMCYKDCLEHWEPYHAEANDQGFKHFSLLWRADETLQWAYKGQPLYTYKGDTRPGEVNGYKVDPKWSPARPLDPKKN